MYSLDYLNSCINPVPTAKVFNPSRPEYYLKDPLAAAAKAQAEKAAVDKPKPEPKPEPQPAKAPEPAVKITLSDAAQAALKKEA